MGDQADEQRRGVKPDSDSPEWWAMDREWDLSSCPYFQGTGTCSFGCVTEPSCQTDRPDEGWPSERPLDNH
jgi:hypothetical protein